LQNSFPLILLARLHDVMTSFCWDKSFSDLIGKNKTVPSKIMDLVGRLVALVFNICGISRTIVLNFETLSKSMDKKGTFVLWVPRQVPVRLFLIDLAELSSGLGVSMHGLGKPLWGEVQRRRCIVCMCLHVAASHGFLALNLKQNVAFT